MKSRTYLIALLFLRGFGGIGDCHNQTPKLQKRTRNMPRGISKKRSPVTRRFGRISWRKRKSVLTTETHIFARAIFGCAIFDDERALAFIPGHHPEATAVGDSP